MKALVLYESMYGNTELVAKSIAAAIKCKAKRFDEVNPSVLDKYDLLILGSPVHGGRAAVTVNEFIKKIPDGCLEKVKVAAFDTRFDPNDHGLGLKILIKIIKFASPRIENELVKKGGIPAGKPEGFIVTAKEGPLKDEELQRAKIWAEQLSSNF
jgi:flavodoxin